MGLMEFDSGQLAVGLQSEEVVPDSSIAEGRISPERAVYYTVRERAVYYTVRSKTCPKISILRIGRMTLSSQLLSEKR